MDGCLVFKSQYGDQVSSSKFNVAVLSLSTKMTRYYCKLAPKLLVPSFQFIIH